MLDLADQGVSRDGSYQSPIYRTSVSGIAASSTNYRASEWVEIARAPALWLCSVL